MDGKVVAASIPIPDVEIDLRSFSWYQEVVQSPNASRLDLAEWDREEGRAEAGFSGFDFCHSKKSAVRILEYYIVPVGGGGCEIEKAGGASTLSVTDEPLSASLVGFVYFSKFAESHKGLCHGGSMCALMDDCIGWMGFCSTGVCLPWCGFTVQVNSSLKKPVPVGSIFKVVSTVDKREGDRKLWITCRLINPANGDIHCEGNGLFLLKKV